MILAKILETFIGLGGGIAVGAGFVAFLTILGIIPRLIQLSRTSSLTRVYTGSIVAGTLFGTYLTFTDIPWEQPLIILAIWGSFHGMFVGMLAAGLTEILNVFPILSKRIGLNDKLKIFLLAIVLGKITGSLFQWLVFVE